MIGGAIRIKDEDIQCAIISRYFIEEFSEQVNNINDETKKGKVVCSVGDRRAEINITDDHFVRIALTGRFLFFSTRYE
jgi:hypothetical protein